MKPVLLIFLLFSGFCHAQTPSAEATKLYKASDRIDVPVREVVPEKPDSGSKAPVFKASTALDEKPNNMDATMMPVAPSDEPKERAKSELSGPKKRD
jgi:hypothetical protein